MNTGNKFSVQYGRIEARIRVPKGNGLWPAFWMMGADFLSGRPWPYNGEVDIMEVLGRNTLEAYSTLHAPAYNGGNGYG
ncbi:glycoside hydrolase family 16 protein [Micromonospora sp. NPDC005174]